MNTFNKNVTENTWKEISNEFKNRNGYLCKMINKALPDSKNLMGYLVRAEIPQGIYPDTIFLALSFVPNLELVNNTKFVKSVAMNKVLVGGERRFKFLNKLNEPKNEYLISKFISPETLSKEDLDYFKNDNFSYNDFYEYVKTFEEKINKYYKNKKVITLVVD